MLQMNTHDLPPQLCLDRRCMECVRSSALLYRRRRCLWLHGPLGQSGRYKWGKTNLGQVGRGYEQAFRFYMFVPPKPFEMRILDRGGREHREERSRQSRDSGLVEGRGGEKVGEGDY